MSKLIDIVIPESNQEGTESFVAAWLKKAGDQVSMHEPLLEINTDKVNMEVPAPADGVLKEILKHENERVEPGDILGRIAAGEVKTSAPAETGPAIPPAVESRPDTESPLVEKGLSPAVRRLVRQHNIDVSLITGSGRGGRITYEDVESFLEGEVKPAAGPLVNKTIPHTPMRRRIAGHMVTSMLKTAPHVTAVFEVDMSGVVRHRGKNKVEFRKKGVNLTYTAYFVAAAVAGLQEVPEVNSRWHDDHMELFQDCNIGIATALDAGLIVPVIHKAKDLNLLELAQRLQDLIGKARNDLLDQKDVNGGTFTITNHGVSGSLIATPIINQPQSAILGVGKLEKRVKVVEIGGNDSIQIRPMLYATLTIDHRALDGFQANRFLSKFAETLETWT